MNLGIFRRTTPLVPAVSLVLALACFGCKADQLSSHGTEITLLYDEPMGCENLGVVIGRGGGLSGAYSKPSVNLESAENNARNLAAERGATHLWLHPENVEQGDGRGPDYQDTQPAMAHGSGTGSTVSIAGTAFKCALDVPESKNALSIQRGTTFIEVKAPTSISLAPLGTLKSIGVYQRVPLASGAGMTEKEMLKLEDQADIQRVAGSLQRVVVDPVKYIPTHRVELVGELGVQSLLYGFGYLQYAGGVYRLTDGEFESTLQLVDAPEPAEAPPATESEAPAEPTTAD